MSLSVIEFIVTALKAARSVKGLTQRALSKATRIPQSHISKIEKGLVDLHASSLIVLARSLGLEVMLVPRGLVPVVEALQRSNGKGEGVPLYQLQEGDENG